MSTTPVRRPPLSPYERSLFGRLPIELIYEIQLFALSDPFPYVSKYLHEVFKQSPPSFRAQYILGRLDLVSSTTTNHTRSALTTALSYPICTQETVEALFRLPGFLAYGKSEIGDSTVRSPIPDLPRRLFRDLKPRVRRGIPVPWSDEDKPLPFLRYLFDDLYDSRRMIAGPPRCDAYGGYALTKAVAAGFAPLVKFLLDNRADPMAKDAIAIMVAIQKKDLQMVKLLVEREPGGNAPKRRRIPDRVVCTRAMLHRAAKAGAQDIVQYLLAKGLTPNIQTLRLLHSDGYQ